MRKRSAGLLLHRVEAGTVEVLLAHPGGPFWTHKDAGAWTIPKGEIDPGEEPLAAALREFAEETGRRPPDGQAVSLGEVTQAGGKVVTAFALAADFEPVVHDGAQFEIEWPPRSGRRGSYPEIDRLAWFDLEEADHRILDGQRPLLGRLAQMLSREPG